MGARKSVLAAFVVSCALVGLLSGCAEPQLHVDIKKVVNELDAGSISEVVCTQEFGPGIASLYTDVVAISGTDQSETVIARLRSLGFSEDETDSSAGDVSMEMNTSHSRVGADIRIYPAELKHIDFGGGDCTIPAEGLTEIEVSGLDLTTPKPQQ